MANPYFQFKQFTINHDRCAMKVTTDSCLFGAWVAKAIKNEKLKIENVLDIGAGTGLLSLMIAQKNKVEIDAVEIDEEAALQAKENIQDSSWKNRINIINQDVLSFEPGKKYDCIISNPPFYENELASEKSKKNIAHHSSQLTISELLKTIKILLKQDGVFFLMYPFKRKEEIEVLFFQNNLYIVDSIIVTQSVNHSPFRVIVKAANKKADLKNETSISIRDEHQQYTASFINLLNDYYLYL